MFKNPTILNRSAKRLKDFEGYNTFTWNSFEIENYDLVINTTSAGLNDDNLPSPKEVLNTLFKTAKYAVDVIYHETPFQRMAKEYGLEIKDGKDMLVYQGVLQFEKFVDFKINRDEVVKIMKEAIEL
jgi:shikimate dehydrogenase